MATVEVKMALEISRWLERAWRALRSPYLCVIEEELARARGEVERLRGEIDALRLENRAVVNSLLGTAGVPPIETPRPLPSVPAVRRRSWPQIATAREIETARTAQKREKEAQRDA
jgi:hypothetical protein